MTFEFIDIAQGSPEWLELRKSKIGASEAPIIMGVSPWMTAYQLWEQKNDLRPPTADNAYMRRGRELEKHALEKFNKLTGLNLYPRVAVHNELQFMLSSYDGCDDYGDVIVEIKCPGPEDHNTALLGMVPDKYIPQIQHQIALVRPKRSFYFSFNEKEDALIETDPNALYIDEMLVKEKEFFDCMTTFTPPKLTDADYIQREDDEWKALAQQYLLLSTSLNNLEKEEKAVKEKLITLAGKSNARGAGLLLSKIMRKGSVDYTAIPELKGLNLESYRKKPSEYWTIRKN